MLRSFLVLMIWLCNLASLSAQDFDHYQLLKARGAIPSVFISPENHQQEGEIPESKSYYIQQLLRSGKVPFGDSITQYLGQIGDYLLRAQPEIREQIQIYVIKSHQINAFTSQEGIIFVTLGLLAHLNNEAELAFILCHEISHFVHNHPAEILLNGQSLMLDRRKKSSRSAIRAQLDQLQRYSQEKESEADLRGLELFHQAGYQLSASLSSLDHLIYHPTPFKELFPLDQLYPEDIPLLPKEELPNLFNHPVDISISDQLDETHPSPQKRKQDILLAIPAYASTSKTLSMFGKARFERFKSMSLFELCHLYLSSQQYESTIFYGIHLLQQYPKSFFLHKSIAQAFYGIAKYSNAGRFWDVHQSFEEIVGEQKRVHFLTEQLDPDELNLFAIGFLWHGLQMDSSDQELTLMLKDLMKECSREEQNRTNIKESSWMTHPYFRYLWASSVDSASTHISVIATDESNKQNLLRGANLGMEKVVFLDPSYLSLDLRQSQPVSLASSQKKKEKFSQLLDQYSDDVQLDHDLLSPDILTAQEVDRFNDIALLNDWIEEKLATQNLDLISTKHTEVQRLYEKYETSYFVWTELVSLAQRRKGKPLIASVGLLFPPFLPYSIYYLLTPKKETILFTMIFDIKNEGTIMTLSKNIRMTDRADLLHSLSYDLVYQIRHPSD